MRFDKIKFWLAAALSLALVACGGGGSNSGTPSLGGGGGGSVNSSVTSLQVKFASASVDNTGSTTNKATITALDANGKGVSGVELGVKVDNNATYSIAATSGLTTAADGTVVADVTIGSDTSLRTITLTATYAAVSATGSFLVTGSKQSASDITLTVSPGSLPNSLTNTATVTAIAVDANRNALANIPISFKVDNGATFSPAGSVTGADGTLTGVVRMGSDQSNRDITITATSGNVERTIKLPITLTKLKATSYLPQIRVSTPAKVVFLLVDNTGAPMQGYTIVVSNSAGTATATGQTSSKGEYTYNFTTPSTGQTLTITAVAAGVTETASIKIGDAEVPVVDATLNPIKSASVSASPAVVTVNAAGSTENSAEIRALFISANNKPVQNIRVWFDLNGDQQNVGGTLSSTVDGVLLYSDASGVARTTYAPGTRFSPLYGVTIRACWDYKDFDPKTQCPNPVATAAKPDIVTTLTVANEQLSVTIGGNNLIEKGPSQLTYVKRYVVQVVDSAGRAKSGVTVSASVDLLGYFKGYYQVPEGESFWKRGGFGYTFPAKYPVSNNPVPSIRPCDDNSGNTCSTESKSWAQDDTKSAVTKSGSGGAAYCENEDLNRNGVVESFFDTYEQAEVSEDQNGNGNSSPQGSNLDPRKADVAISIEGSSSTNANGEVVLKLEYPQTSASWVRFNILVAASGVAGTEGRATYASVLPVDSTAISETQKDPPFKVSPYGVAATNIYPRRNLQGQTGWLCTNPN